MDGINRREFLVGTVGIIFLPRRKITIWEDLMLKLNGVEPFTDYFEGMGLLVRGVPIDDEIFTNLTFELVDRWKPYRRWFPQGRKVSVQSIRFRPYRHYVQWWSEGTRVRL